MLGYMGSYLKINVTRERQNKKGKKDVSSTSYGRCSNGKIENESCRTGHR